MAKAEKETPLARRLRELEEEQKALRQHIKSLSRQAQRQGNVGLESSVSSRIDAASSVDEASTRIPDSDEVLQDMEDAAGASPPPADEGRMRGQDRPVSPGYAATVRATPRKPAPDTDRFATYFASGSFGKARPLGHEKRLQRNKAIFMVVFVILVGFLLYRFFF